MKKREVFTIVLAVLLALASFVGCNSEVNEVAAPATVSFTPTAKKALNQSGSSANLSEDVKDYYWKYWCSDKANDKAVVGGTQTDDLEWNDFTFASGQVEKGIGKITGLAKGQSYYFGLRAYSSDTNAVTGERDLIWEGFHIKSTDNTKALESVKLLSKTQLITIDVYTKGFGYLYFDVCAPVDEGDTALTTSTNAGSNGTDVVTAYPRFVYTYSQLDGNTSKTDSEVGAMIANTSKTNVNDGIAYWMYSDEAGTPHEKMTAGTYLFTIWEQYWDVDLKKYSDKNDRRQILIVNVGSGVDTVISGALDSYSMEVFDYYAWDGENQWMKVNFTTATNNVVQFKTEVFSGENTSSSDKQIMTVYSGNHAINLVDGKYATIKLSSATDVRFFVNGDEFTTGTDEYGYFTSDSDFYEIDGVPTNVKNGTASDSCIVVKGSYGNDYLLTIVYDKDGVQQSVSFTVKATSGNNYVTFQSDMPFTLADPNTTKAWSKIEYSFDAKTWKTWDGKGITDTNGKNDVYYIYLRGTGNTVITGEAKASWTYTGSQPVYVSGNMENLLDYATVQAGNHPTMDSHCFENLFSLWTQMATAPELLAETVTAYCYKAMFSGCTMLKEAPVLPAKTIKDKTQCYCEMFKGCTSLKYLKVAFTSWEDAATKDWLVGNTKAGRFECPEALVSADRKNGGVDREAKDTVPELWTINGKKQK